MKRAAHVVAVATALLAVAACNARDEPFARAYRADNPSQLIGGDVGMARVGDFIIENDRVRIAVLDTESSPAPGVFGGTFVDADLQRPEAQYRGGTGHDQLAEVIPFANLLWPRPGDGEIAIVADGSDGGAAIVRVSAEGGVFLEALSLLTGPLVGTIFPTAKFALRIETDYILEPGKPYVRMLGRAIRTDVPAAGEPIIMDAVTGPVPVFPRVLGDAANNLAGGMVTGDFVFFGAQNDIFAPGMGFDEEKTVFDALFEGKDTFTTPLAFDFVAAAGESVSYGYFNVAAGQDPAKVLVPIITSSSTAFVTAVHNCSAGPEDDADCDARTSWQWERYFVIGKGDVASVADVVFEVRGIPTGRISGVVRGRNGDAQKNARVYVLRDPDASRTFATVAEVADANLRATGDPGVLNAIDADVGRDPVEDGDFTATMPAGSYLIVAQNHARTSTSAPQRITVSVGATTVVAPVVPPPARVRYRVTDGQGRRIAAKLGFVAVLPGGSLADGDGLRRPYLGEGRLGNGVRFSTVTASGEGVVDVEAGEYEVVVSHGPEHAAHRQRLTLAPGQEVVVSASLSHEVDTRGWIGGDFHLHAEPSFDSGMKLADRVTRAMAEGVELAVATDHDIVTDYAPAVRALGAHDRIKTGVGVELSTLELGHFIAFPLKYEALTIPDHGAPDWTCLDGPQIAAALDDRIAPGQGGVKIMAHPRDGFIGHISQIGLDPYDFTRELSFLEQNNVLLSRSTCAFDAMEVFNGKRFDLVRTPTNREVIIYNRCMGRIDAATDVAGLDAACPEVTQGGPLAVCEAGARFTECQMLHRRRLAYLMAREILIRTPEEQLAIWTYTPTGGGENACDPAQHPNAIGEGIANLPCIHHAGTYDDWMRWLDHGLNVTLTGASDSHGSAREPGFPRTWVEHDAERAADIDVGAVADQIVAHRAQASFGPFIEARVGAASAGDVATVSGDEFELTLRVQTASWFGVDRVEIYVSGLLEHVIELSHGPEVIVDVDTTVRLPVPAEDGFVSVIALGTREENLMGPVAYDIAFGELQLPRVAALAFASIPGFSAVFSATPIVPDFFPVFPMAVSNAILLDADGDGQWQPSDVPAPFCQLPCDPAAANPTAACPVGLTCLSTGDCGLVIDGECKTGPPGTEDRVPFDH